MGSFDGKVAMITGASRGIGRALAFAIAQEGARVVVTGRTTDVSVHKALPGTIDETVRRIEDMGGKAVAVPADLTKDQEVEALVRKAEEAFGRVDILVNNAAANFPMPFLDLPMRRFDVTMAVELRAPALLCKLVLPGMVQRRQGRILNVTGQPRTPYTGKPEPLARRYAPMLAHFTAKSALDHFTWGLAAEVQEHGGVVNCLRIDLPIPTEGNMHNRLGEAGDRARWESPQVAVDAALWLLRQGPSYTGVNIEISQMRERFGFPARQPWTGDEPA